MKWSKHIIFGGLLVLAFCTGCDTIDASLSLFSDSKPAAPKGPVREIVVSGSVETVAASTKQALEGVGLSAGRDQHRRRSARQRVRPARDKNSGSY